MQGPSSGMPRRSARGGNGTGLSVSSLPWTKIRFWSFGQFTWERYVAAPWPFSDSSSYWTHLGSLVGCRLDGSSRYSPGITTTRSLLPARFTAAWMWRNLQRSASRRLIRRSRRAAFRDSFLVGALGRTFQPFVRALLIERFSLRTEFGLQTTYVSPRALRRSADASPRAFGTLPPAAGVTLVSGAGSGQ